MPPSPTGKKRGGRNLGSKSRVKKRKGKVSSLPPIFKVIFFFVLVTRGLSRVRWGLPPSLSPSPPLAAAQPKVFSPPGGAGGQRREEEVGSALPPPPLREWRKRRRRRRRRERESERENSRGKKERQSRFLFFLFFSPSTSSSFRPSFFRHLLSIYPSQLHSGEEGKTGDETDRGGEGGRKAGRHKGNLVPLPPPSPQDTTKRRGRETGL